MGSWGIQNQILIEDANSGYASGTACSLEYRDWGRIHGVALDTLTYEDTITVPKLSKLALYKAALVDTILSTDSTVAAFVDSMKATAFGELESLTQEILRNSCAERRAISL